MAADRRMAELDVLRGFAVAVMILVVSPGAWEYTYVHLQHADWHGWTFADLVFPDFLFGVGMAIGVTFGRSLDPDADRRGFWTKVARRVIGLLLLGLALNYLAVIGGRLGAAPVGPAEVPALRIPGVLQRIAICYFLAGLIVLATSIRGDGGLRQPKPKAIAIAIFAILLVYWLLLSFVPVPGFGPGDLSKAGNLPAYIDRAVFTPPHMWQLGAQTWRGPVLYDPEGLLASLPATANVLFGVLAIGVWRQMPRRRGSVLLILGALLVAAALLLDPLFPINKKIWTSTFVLLTSGISCLALVAVAALLKAPKAHLLLGPLRVLGGNAILAFSISIVLSAVASVPFLGGAETKTLQRSGFDIASRLIADPYLASLACAFVVLGFIVALLWPIHSRGIHVRL
jgi:predicted acyltransferase